MKKCNYFELQQTFPCHTKYEIKKCVTFYIYEITIKLFFLNNQPDALIIPILFYYKTLHVSGIFSVHHQEFSTLHSALVSFMQVFDDRFQAESGWNIIRILPVPNVQKKTPDDGHRRCPKHVEFYNRINLDN
jgi:hypothetical protein